MNYAKIKKSQWKIFEDTEVIMADNIFVVNPVFSSKYNDKKAVVITDE